MQLPGIMPGFPVGGRLVLSGSLTQVVPRMAGFSPERVPRLAASVVD